MAALVNPQNAMEVSVPQHGMLPVSPQLRAFLQQAYGVEPHMMVYYYEGEPTRVYVNVYGRLRFIDIPATNMMPQMMERGVQVPAVEDKGNDVQNLALKACELARNDPQLRDDLETRLNEVLGSVLSKFPEKRSRNVVPTDESSKSACKYAWLTLTDAEREEILRERRKRNAYKTSLCKSFRDNGTCEYGEACVFAHGERELRLPPQAHPKYKTQLCNKFSMWNYCPYGARCQYIHHRSNGNARLLGVVKGGAGSLQKNSPCADIVKCPKGPAVGQRIASLSCISSPIALGNHSSFTEQGGFCSSMTATDLSKAGNQGHSAEAISNCAEGASSGPSNFNGNEYGNHSNGSFGTVVNKTILDQLNEQLLNMKMEDGNNMFSQSCFPRIGSDDAK